MPAQLSQRAAAAIITSNVKGAVPIGEIVEWVFGKTRLREALASDSPNDDPELLRFILLIDALVDKKWSEKGITRAHGPYSERQF